MALIKCSECGKEFSDKARFCPSCGCPTDQMEVANVYNIPRVQNTTSNVGEMNRDFLLLYLKNILDLEMAKEKIIQMKNDEERKVANKVNELNYQDRKNESSTGGDYAWGFFWLFGAVFCIGFGILADLVFITFGGIVSAVFCIGAFSSAIGTSNENKRIRKYNSDQAIMHLSNMEIANKLVETQKDRNQMLDREVTKVNDLLKHNYDADILPTNYRNLASVYYVYDMLKTSKMVSFQHALFSQQMDEGIKAIMNQLGLIINQNQQIMLQNRRAEAKRDQHALDIKRQLSAIHDSSLRNEEYNRLTMDYSRANAYFNMANYLYERYEI